MSRGLENRKNSCNTRPGWFYIRSRGGSLRKDLSDSSPIGSGASGLSHQAPRRGLGNAR